MEQKTKIHAEDDKQELTITREFDLPLEMLFKAYEDPAIVEQWMGTKVLKLENKKHGGWKFETSDPQADYTHNIQVRCAQGSNAEATLCPGRKYGT